jgi:hypothetical protein
MSRNFGRVSLSVSAALLFVSLASPSRAQEPTFKVEVMKPVGVAPSRVIDVTRPAVVDPHRTVEPARPVEVKPPPPPPLPAEKKEYEGRYEYRRVQKPKARLDGGLDYVDEDDFVYVERLKPCGPPVVLDAPSIPGQPDRPVDPNPTPPPPDRKEKDGRSEYRWVVQARDRGDGTIEYAHVRAFIFIQAVQPEIKVEVDKPVWVKPAVKSETGESPGREHEPSELPPINTAGGRDLTALEYWLPPSIALACRDFPALDYWWLFVLGVVLGGAAGGMAGFMVRPSGQGRWPSWS